MSARRKALRSPAASTLNFRVQGLNRQRHAGEPPSKSLAVPDTQEIYCMPATDTPPLGRPQLRRVLRERRRALPPLMQRRAARGLYQQLAQHPLFRRARHVALYLASDGEIDPQLLLKAAQARGKQVYLPVLKRWPRCRMVFQRLAPHDKMSTNRFGILEPRRNLKRQRKTWALDLVLLPLVGFDRHGGRLGMGGGFYDRNLAYRAYRQHWHSPALIGLAHSCQQVERLPLASWDIALNATVTEQAWYRQTPN
jgi:5-formyltetrahydrofolate cyclo-ligase